MMKAVVILASLVGATVCYPWGLPQQVHDTPEVAAAKSAHLARCASHSWAAQDRSSSGHEDDGSWKDETNIGSWNSANRDNHGSSKDDGSWKHYDDGSWRDDTHSWNHDSFGDKWEGQSWNQWSSGSHREGQEKKWTGPIALPPGYDKHGAPLPVLDTPEVKAAKSKHFHLYHHAAANAAPAHDSHGYHH